MEWVPTVGVVAGGLLLLWLVLLAGLWRARPDELTARGALRLLPDVLRLVRRLASDRTLPRAVRFRLWLLLAYLVSPIDLVPDFIPVVGQLDDAAIAAVVLRGVVRSAGPEVVAEHWPGSARTLNVVLRLAGYG